MGFCFNIEDIFRGPPLCTLSLNADIIANLNVKLNDLLANSGPFYTHHRVDKMFLLIPTYFLVHGASQGTYHASQGMTKIIDYLWLQEATGSYFIE